MLKPEFAKALDLVKLGVILRAITKQKSEYITSSDIAELTELFGTQGVLSATEVRRILNKFDIKAENNRNGYKTKEIRTKLFEILEDNNLLDWVIL